MYTYLVGLARCHIFLGNGPMAVRTDARFGNIAAYIINVYRNIIRVCARVCLYTVCTWKKSVSRCTICDVMHHILYFMCSTYESAVRIVRRDPCSKHIGNSVRNCSVKIDVFPKSSHKTHRDVQRVALVWTTFFLPPPPPSHRSPLN